MNDIAVVVQDDGQRVDEEQFVTMTVDGQTFGIPILTVQDIVEARQITPVPLAPSAIAGVMNLRGRIVTVIDLRRCLGLDEEFDDSKAMGVTVEYHNDLYTLLVDTIGDVRSLHHRDFEKAPVTVQENVRKLSTGVYRLDGDLLVVLDVERVLDAERLVKTPPVVLKRRKSKDEKNSEDVDLSTANESVDDTSKDGASPDKEDSPSRPDAKKTSEPKGDAGAKKEDNVVPLKKAEESAVPDEPAAPTGPLFDRIGGDAAVEAAVDLFYGKVIADPDLKPFFDGVDMDKQSFMMRLFLTGVFGGVQAYNGRSLREAHKPLVEEQGLNGGHFDKVAGHLQATLQDLSVPSDIIGEVMTLAASTRDDVLNL
jgi:chemotaxis signal transduction protein/truncated hemoglobin YjbI